MPRKTIYNDCCKKSDIHVTHTSNSQRMSTAQKEANMIRQQRYTANMTELDSVRTVVPPRNTF